MELSQETGDLIRKKLTSLGYTEISYEVEPGSSKGDNYLGILTRSKICAKSKEGVPRQFHWIIKSASSNPDFRALMSIRNIFTREIFVYTKVLTEFTRLQDELNLPSPFLNFPEVHTTSTAIPEIVIMEDLKHHGYVMLDRRQPLDHAHCRLALQSYARFHGLSFALRRKRPEIFKSLAGDLEENFFSKMGVEGMNVNFSKQNEKVFRALKKGDGRARAKFEEYSKNPFGRVIEALKWKNAGDYAVLTHGDSWVNNILFKYSDLENPEVPTDLYLIDFQLSRLGSPALDLSYFIFTCTSKPLRDQHFDSLLKFYHEELGKFLRQFKLDADTVFPFPVLLEHMKQFSVYGLLMTIMVTHLMMSDGDETPDLEKMDLTDHAGFERTFNYESKNESLFSDRIRDVVVDFAARDYI